MKLSDKLGSLPTVVRSPILENEFRNFPLIIPAKTSEISVAKKAKKVNWIKGAHERHSSSRSSTSVIQMEYVSRDVIGCQ